MPESAITAEPALDARLTKLFGSDPDALADPFGIYARLRRSAPAYAFGPSVLITRYGDVKALARDSIRFSSQKKQRGSRTEAERARLTDEQREAWDEVFGFEALFMQRRGPDDDHDRVRRVAQLAFTPRRIAALEQSIHRYTRELVAAMTSDDVVDFAVFAYQMPLMVITDLLGVPAEDHELVHQWSLKLGRNRQGAGEPGPLMEARDAMREFRAYVAALIEEQRSSQIEGSLALTLMGAEEDDRLSFTELTAMYIDLLFAGHETTANLIGTGVLELLRQRDQWQLLCDKPALAPKATEELLRFVTPVQFIHRIPYDDVEVAGFPIPAGTTVVAMLAGANRDPSTFDDPEVLRIEREDSSRHLSFGFGSHFCLGNALARAEARIALETLATRFPDVEISGDMEWVGPMGLRRLSRFPVRLGRDRDPMPVL